MGRDRGGQAGHPEIAQRPLPSSDGLIPVATPNDELGDQVVVVLADLLARLDAAVDADAETGRLAVLDERPRIRGEVARRILCVDAKLDGVPRGLSLRERERLAGRHAQLLLDEIDTGHHLGDRVLDLDTRVHLEEINLTGLVDEELDRSRVHVVGGPGHGQRRLADPPTAAPH